MIGLLNKNILSTGIKIQYILALMLMLMVVPFLPIMSNFIIHISYVILILAPISLIASIVSGNGNSAIDILFPVKRSTVVIAKYITYFLAYITSVFVVLFYLYINQTLYDVKLLGHEVNTVFLGLCVSLAFGAVFLPLLFQFGSDKWKELSYISFFASLIPIRFLMEIIKILFNLDSPFDIYNDDMLIYSLLFITFIFFICSSFVSITIIKRKEY